jgi:hypothetical protein
VEASPEALSPSEVKANVGSLISEHRLRTLPGLVVRKAPKGYTVVTLTYRADPEKDSLDWILARRDEMPDERAFRREYLLDWTSAEGNAFYPEFANAPQRYVSTEVHFNPKLPVYRGWDFGFRNPACVWLQLRPDGRVWVLHDLLPSDIDTHSFRDLVLFLSGQSLTPTMEYNVNEELEKLRGRPRALLHLQSILADPPWFDPIGPRQDYPVPFFPPGTRFIDFSGPEAYKTQPIESASAEKSDAEVLSSAGINLNWLWQPVSYGENIIRRLLLDGDDGRGPMLQFYPSARNLIDGFAGGIVYAKPTPASPYPDTAHKDGLFEHCHDAFRYTIVNMVPVSEAGMVKEVRLEPVRSQKEHNEKLRILNPDQREDVQSYIPYELKEDLWKI